VFQINSQSGELGLFLVDFAFPGFIPVDFFRFYRTGDVRDGPLGMGWRFPFAAFVSVDADKFTFHRSQDTQVAYRYQDIGADGVHGPSSTTVVWEEPTLRIHTDQRVYRFSRTMRAGRLALDSLADLCGNTLQFAYDETGRLERLRDTLGRTLVFMYDARSHVRAIDIETAIHDRRRLMQYEYSVAGDLELTVDAAGGAAKYEYDNHLLVAYANRLGGRYFAEYDERRRCIRSWRSDGRQLRLYHYGVKRATTVVTNALGYRTLTRFDEQARTLEEVDPAGGTTRYTYDSAGKLVGVFDAAGTATFGLSEEGTGRRLYVDQRGSQVTVERLPSARGFKITDAEGGVWRYDHDERGLLRRFVSPSGAVWAYKHDLRGALVEAVSPTGAIRLYRASDDYRSVTVVDQVGLLSHRHYDAYGRILEERIGDDEPTVFSYDVLGRLTLLRSPAGSVSRFEWDAEGNLTAATYPDGAAIRYSYSPFNEPLSVVEPLGEHTQYDYDDDGRLTIIRNANGEVMRFSYNSVGLLVEQKFFDGTGETYAYDDSGHLQQVTDASGGITRFSFDPGGRLLAVTTADGKNASYEYDSTGALTAASFDGSSIAIEYDQDRRIVRETQDDKTVEYRYDSGGRLIELRFLDDSAVLYEYDARDAPTAIVTPTGSVHRFTHDGRSRLVRWTLPGGRVAVEYEYHVFNRLKSWQVRGNGLRRSFEYDARGRPSAVAGSSGSVGYEYSLSNHVVAVRRNNALSESFAYDACGNLQSSMRTGPLSYATGNRLVRDVDRQYKYDPRGRLVAWTYNREETHFTYDGLGRLTQVVHPNGTVTAFRYDPVGRRVAKIHDGREIRYLWSRDTVLAAWSRDISPYLSENYGDSAEARAPVVCIHRPGEWVPFAISVASEDHAIIANGDGVPAVIVAPDGEVLWQAELTLWGETHSIHSARVQPDRRFPGQYFDEETGLVYNYHRYYDPRTGRFITPDPIGINGGSLNLYLYGTNPLTEIDPYGLASTTIQCSSYCNTNPSPPCQPRLRSPATQPTPNIPDFCKPSCGTSIHNDCINLALDMARKLDPNARRDQSQAVTGPQGSPISGRNRPDIAFSNNGAPCFIEFDNHPYSRVNQHAADLCGNAPNAVVLLVCIPQGNRYQPAGNIPRHTPQGQVPTSIPPRPDAQDCGW
jgi:RHS repeat-associated protein